MSASLSGMSGSESTKISQVSHVDISELFAYKVLEKTGFGSKVQFVTNPDLYGGLYIAAEEVDNFNTLKSLEEKAIVKNALNLLGNRVYRPSYVTGFEGNEIIVKLTVFDILARSMLLSDLNSYNLGFVIPGELRDLKSFDVKIVDFMRPGDEIVEKVAGSNSTFFRQKLENKGGRLILPKHLEYLSSLIKSNVYVYADIFETFLDANTFTKYDSPLLVGILRRNNPANLDEATLVAVSINRKRQFGRLAFQEMPILQTQVSQDGKTITFPVLEQILNESEKEVEAFISAEESEKVMVAKRENMRSNLRMYKNAIVENMRLLYNGIIEGFILLEEDICDDFSILDHLEEESEKEY